MDRITLGQYVLFLSVVICTTLFGLNLWYSSIRDQCEALGGTILIMQPLTPVCVKLERTPLT